VRWSCSTDNQCGGGYCVEGQCFSTLGSCNDLPQ
jgi:hypothetical protein